MSLFGSLWARTQLFLLLVFFSLATVWLCHQSAVLTINDDVTFLARPFEPALNVPSVQPQQSPLWITKSQNEQTILSRSVCHEESILLHPERDLVPSQSSSHRWMVRLALRAIDQHQRNCQQHFLVIRLSHNGLGANVRMGIIPSLLAGIVANRTLVIEQDDWSLASCPSKNWNCFFQPLSSCILPDTNHSHTLTRPERRRLFAKGELPEAVQDVPIIYLSLAYRPQRIPNALYATIAQRTSIHPCDPYYSQLQQAALDLQQPWTAPAYNYYGAGDAVFAAAMVYSLQPARPVPHSPLPTAEPLLGLAIRDSDKCGTESECLAPIDYIQAARALEPQARIVVTTESATVQTQLSIAGPGVIFNEYDVLQGTGYLKEMKTNFTADQVMESLVSSMQMHLAADVGVGNCCSNLHLMLKDLREAGCGRGTSFTCMQQHPLPQYRLCCSWDKECNGRVNESEK